MRKTCSMNPLKQKTTMKKNSFLWAALSMTAALVMTACSSDDNDMTEAPVAPSTSKTIPYTVTVGGDEATTRATVDADNKTLRFATGDKLYITGTNIQGVLDLQAGGAGETNNVTFSGELTYDGSGSPADDLSLTATLVSAQQTVGTQVSVNAAGAVTVNYPTTAYCSSINDAVQKYSNLTGTSTYGARAFTLTQQTAFLNFVITFEDATTTGTELTAVVNNNSSDICSASVTTETVSEKVVAKFVLPVAAGTTLSSANVKMGDKEAISFGASQTLTGKVYNVKKTIAASSSLTGQFSVSTTKKVCFSKGNLQATYDGSSWTWAFAENQWDCIGNAEGNTKVSASTPFVSGYSGSSTTVDLFCWVGTSSTWTDVAQYGITSSTATNNTNGYGNNASEDLKSDWGNTISDGYTWFTLTSAEWEWMLGPMSSPTPGTNCRTSSTIGGVTNARWVTAVVHSTNGLIIYPDALTWNEATMGTAPTTSNAAKDFTNNTFTDAQWSALEAAGCVFLPAAGYRHESWSVTNAGSYGNYWSSSPCTSDVTQAYDMHFDSRDLYNSLNPASINYRYRAFSVRLVRQVE